MVTQCRKQESFGHTIPIGNPGAGGEAVHPKREDQVQAMLSRNPVRYLGTQAVRVQWRMG